MQHIIDEIEKHLKETIEQPSPAFFGMPICPFASKARTDKRIDYQIGPFSCADIADGTALANKIEEFKKQDAFEVVMFIHSDKAGLTVPELNEIVERVNLRVKPDMIAFS